MVKAREGISPKDEKYFPILFVEGSEKSLDPHVLNELLSDFRRIKVLTLGPAYHLESVARAFNQNPDFKHYFFLIDRDYHDDETVDKSWREFPNPEIPNLLIWRRRHLENYFLDPDYLFKIEDDENFEKRFLKTEIKNLILELAQKRIYLDAVNMVIIEIRENIKERWIKCFDKIDGFENKEKALEKITNLPEFNQIKSKVSKQVSKDTIKNLFIKKVDEFSGNGDKLEYGKGKWLYLVDGKKILRIIANKCFKVTDNKGIQIQEHEEKIRRILKNLLRKPLTEQPPDFQDLYDLMSKQVKK